MNRGVTCNVNSLLNMEKRYPAVLIIVVIKQLRICLRLKGPLLAGEGSCGSHAIPGVPQHLHQGDVAPGTAPPPGSLPSFSPRCMEHTCESCTLMLLMHSLAAARRLEQKQSEREDLASAETRLIIRCFCSKG